MSEESNDPAEPTDSTVARVQNALRTEFNIGTDDLDVLRDYCTQYCDVKINTEKVNEFEINSLDWTVNDANVSNVLAKVANIVPLLSVFAKNFKHLLHSLHATPSQTRG